MHFEAGRYAEAAAAYARLVERDPKDASLHTSLAGALGRARPLRRGAASSWTPRSRLEPLNVEAYHNRARDPRAPGQARRGHRAVPDGRPLQPAVRALAAGARPPHRLGGRARPAQTRPRSAPRSWPRGEPGRAARRLRRGHEAARRSRDGSRPRYVARLPVPLQRRLPHGRHAGRHPGPREGPRDRAGQRALQEQPGAPGATGRQSRTRASDEPDARSPGRGAVRSLAARAVFVRLRRSAPAGRSTSATAASWWPPSTTLGIPHPSGYPALRPAGQALDAAGPVRLRRLPDEPVQRGLRRRGLRRRSCASAARLGLRPWRPRPPRCSCLLPELLGRGQHPARLRANALFVALATAAAFAWHRSREPARPGPGRFSAGSAPTNHTFMAVFAVALAALRLVAEPALAATAAGADPAPGGALRRRACCRTSTCRCARAPTRGSTGATRRRSAASSAWSCGGTSGAAPCIEGPGDLPSSLGDYLRSLGAETLWAGALLALVGGLRGAGGARWPVLLPAPRHGGEPRRPGVPRLAHRHLHLAPLLHPVLPDGGAARGMGVAGPARAAAPRRPLPAAGRCPLWPCFSRLARRSTAAATASPRTSAATLLATLPPGRTSRRATTTSSSS